MDMHNIQYMYTATNIYCCTFQYCNSTADTVPLQFTVVLGNSTCSKIIGCTQTFTEPTDGALFRACCLLFMNLMGVVIWAW